MNLLEIQTKPYKIICRIKNVNDKIVRKNYSGPRSQLKCSVQNFKHNKSSIQNYTIHRIHNFLTKLYAEFYS